MEDEPERQCGCDGEVGVLPLPAPRADVRWRPGGDRRRSHPQGDVTSSDQGTIVGRPVRDAVLRLVRGMDSRFHPLSVAVGSVSPPHSSESPTLALQAIRIHAPTPLRSGSVADSQ